jgi:hypothetical protein
LFAWIRGILYPPSVLSWMVGRSHRRRAVQHRGTSWARSKEGSGSKATKGQKVALEVREPKKGACRPHIRKEAAKRPASAGAGAHQATRKRIGRRSASRETRGRGW